MVTLANTIYYLIWVQKQW